MADYSPKKLRSNAMALILVADDSLFMRGFISESLRLEGYRTVEAETGVRTLGLLTELTPDCVLLDLNLPDMSGLDVLQAVRNRGGGVPIIVLTAHVQESIRRQCLRQGATAVLHKPPQHEELLRATAAVVGQHEVARA